MEDQPSPAIRRDENSRPLHKRLVYVPDLILDQRNVPRTIEIADGSGFTSGSDSVDFPEIDHPLTAKLDR